MAKEFDDGFMEPTKYDRSLDTCTPEGRARREIEDARLREYMAERAQYYDDHPDEVDVDSLVDEHYAALVEHHAGHGPYPIGPMFSVKD